MKDYKEYVKTLSEDELDFDIKVIDDLEFLYDEHNKYVDLVEQRPLTNDEKRDVVRIHFSTEKMEKILEEIIPK